MVQQWRIMGIIFKGTELTLIKAAASLKSGNLVAFPTETVYGLGADACNKGAISRLYKVKERPTNHPLIVHISSKNYLPRWAKEIPDYAVELANNFWPGPLTLILPKTDLALDNITGGQNSVGVRVPSHPLALELLKRFEDLGGQGIAAPSANKFGAVSPTSYIAVKKELGRFLTSSDFIIDGKNSKIGIESTIISCLTDRPIILRPGAVTKKMIKHCLGIKWMQDFQQIQPNGTKASGLLNSHYAPKAKVFLDGLPTIGEGFIALNNFATPEGAIRLAAPKNVEEYAYTLYEALRQADSMLLSQVYVIPPSGDGLAVAIRDRLSKAAFKA
jgi:L-threonylcarbamoyladenylate synthase